MSVESVEISQAERAPVLPPGSTVSGPRSTSWWGMILIIINEAILFASLLASYFYLRFNSPLWPPQGIQRPELVLSSINTAILLGSSFVMQWGLSGIRKDNSGRLRLGLAIAFVMGAVFLGIQIYEYTQLEFSPQEVAYASLFWTITGIHATHVLVALLMNAYIQVRANLGQFDGARHQGVENVTLYWHFVDVVWVFIFTSLFLSPYF
jgi:heme/copper-type cytochrome/quinol oxidase subunit 3